MRPENIIYNPQKRVGQFVVAYKDYEDIRVDSDLDGKVDLWYVKKGSLEVLISFKDSQPMFLQGQLTSALEVSSFLYAMEADQWRLKSSNIRKPLLMNLPQEKCEDKDTKDKVESFTEELGKQNLAGNIENHLLDRSCKENLAPKAAQRLATALNKALSPNAPIESCLEKEDFAKEISPKGQSFSAAKLLATKFKLQRLQLAQHSEKHGPLVKCEKLKGQTSIMTTHENSKTIFIDPESIARLGVIEVGQVLTASKIEHELLHRAGLKTEEQVKVVEQFCAGEKTENPAPLQSNFFEINQVISDSAISEATNNAADKTSANTADTAIAPTKEPTRGIASENQTVTSKPTEAPKTANQTAAAKASASIPMEMTVAQSQVPTAPKLSESIYNPPPATEAGAQQALVQSASESSGVLRVANNLVGAMNTRATASGNLASSDSKTSSDSDISGGKKARSSGSSKTKSDAFAAFNRNSVGSDEKIVEQITLDGNSTQPATVKPSSPREATGPKTAQTGTLRETSGGAGAGQNEVARATASSGGNSGGGFDSSSPNTSGGGSAPSRSPAAVSPSIEAKARASSKKEEPVVQAGAGNTTRDEVVTFISNGSYRTTKEKLQKPDFKKQLESQKITILDLYGNSIGASKGEVIFLDQGDRFVRQK